MSQRTASGRSAQYQIGGLAATTLPYQRDRNGMFASNRSGGDLEIRYGDADLPTVVVPDGALWEMPEPTYVGEISFRLVGASGTAVVTELF